MFVVGFFFIFGQGLLSVFTNYKIAEVVPEQQKVLIKDTVVGNGNIAVIGNRITVNYVGHFSDGKIFDSSIARNEPFQFVLGAGQVIKGWDEGIVGMSVGGKRTLTIPPELGYGANDYGPIPGNSTLVFEVELLKVEK
ncbi:MAG: FKBP-type peptidyl-prolyl cis-trans isomerase [Candidatus Zambryskibacteria bacterium]|nr:FKBP-type peptidyl-prolyl cis-trans isomerase [Candidatus Zambryskibacteria bacterium]